MYSAQQTDKYLTPQGIVYVFAVYKDDVILVKDGQVIYISLCVSPGSSPAEVIPTALEERLQALAAADTLDLENAPDFGTISLSQE